MSPNKVLGGVLVLLGLVFSGITRAYFAARTAKLPPDSEMLRSLVRRQKRAVFLDCCFIAVGFALILD